MKKAIKCCLVVTLGLAVVGYSKEESSRSGAISIKDCASIFIPAGGGGVASIYLEGIDGSYWASSPRSHGSNARYLHFSSSCHRTGDMYRYLALCVRPVQGFTNRSKESSMSGAAEAKAGWEHRMNCRAAPAPGSPPLRVGVFVDTGARGSVLAYSRLATLSPDCEAKFIDGAAVRAGALSGVDVLLMSGGSSVDISASLGDEGRAELERFIREGGGYLGTCAGALLMMETAKYKGLGVIPYTRVEAPPRGGGTIKTIWADCARDLAGIKPGIHTTTYHRGPVMTPCEGHPRLGDFTVMARFGCNIRTMRLDPDCPSMGGYASCIAGKYGKGKVWVFSDHPEVNPHTMDLVIGGIRYLTGRTIRFVRDQKKPGQFVVGCPTSFSPGAEGAAFAMELANDPDFHVRGGGFASSPVDAVVICDSPDASRLKKLATPAGARDLKQFLKRGGHVVAWGRGAKCVSGMVKDGDGLHFVKGPAEAMETLHALRKRPLPSVPAPTFGAALPRKEGAVRTGFLLGPGSSGSCLFRLLRTIASSPN